MEVKGSMCYLFTSPILKEEDRKLSECPLSVVLKNHSHIFNAISLHGMVYESGSINWFDLSTWAQQAVRVVGSERQRLWEMSRKDEKLKRDSAVGLEMRSNRG